MGSSGISTSPARWKAASSNRSTTRSSSGRSLWTKWPGPSPGRTASISTPMCSTVTTSLHAVSRLHCSASTVCARSADTDLGYRHPLLGTGRCSDASRIGGQRLCARASVRPSRAGSEGAEGEPGGELADEHAGAGDGEGATGDGVGPRAAACPDAHELVDVRGDVEVDLEPLVPLAHRVSGGIEQQPDALAAMGGREVEAHDGAALRQALGHDSLAHPPHQVPPVEMLLGRVAEQPLHGPV